MIIEKNVLLKYRDQLEPITQIDNAMRRIEAVALYYSKDIDENEQAEIESLKEYALFTECVKRPFYDILHNSLKRNGCIKKLYDHLCDDNSEVYIPLRHEEIFHLLWSIGQYNATLIVDEWNLPSNKKDDIVASLKKNSPDTFISAMSDFDLTDVVKPLWKLRYIMFGQTTHLDEKSMCDRMGKSNWLQGVDNSRFFLPLSQEEENWVIRKSIAALGGKPFGISSLKRFINDVSFYESLCSADKKISAEYYTKWKSYINSLNDFPWKDISVSFSDYANISSLYCQKATRNILGTTLFKESGWNKFENEFADWKDEPSQSSNTTSSFNMTMKDIERFWMEHSEEANIGLHKETELLVGVYYPKYKVKSRKKTYGTNVSYYENKTGGEAYIKDIILHSYAIVDVYEKVRNTISYSESSVLGWIINNSTWTKKMMAFYGKNVGNSNYGRPDRPKYSIDLNSEHSQWFINILDSKISDLGYKSDIIHDCVEKLYNCLMNKEYLDSTTNKDLFIYRFSGTGKPFGPETKIKWKGKNVLLGHIIRCLTSDSNKAPINVSITANFFESNTGKQINLATARQVEVENFDKEKNLIDKNFVEAVELLRSSGFINVELTMKRR